MSFNRYFQDELLALRRLGREFSSNNPVLAPFFSTEGSDPDVERILEGFAFLSARLKQKLDDEFPEITHALFSLLWANYLRPIPATSIVEFKPKPNVSDTFTMPRGSEVESVPVEETICRFRTIYDTHVYPIKIIEQSIIDRSNEKGIILHLESLDTGFDSLEIPYLRFHFTGGTTYARTLYFSLLKRLKEIKVVIRDQNNKAQTILVLPASAISHVGFKEEEGLLPYPEHAFSGYRILQEYFAFPEKFLFLDLTFPKNFPSKELAELAQKSQMTDKMELHFILENLPNAYENLSIENWKLFCVPVVNLFNMDASPITLDQKQSEYRIVPDPREPYHYSVYSVDRVTSWKHETRASGVYLPFESFQHDKTTDFDESENTGDTAYYRLRLATSPKDNTYETYISFSKPNNSLILTGDETISMELTCTNRDLPRKLKTGDINAMVANSSVPLDVRNISPVIPSCSPPPDSDIFWRLLSNMSLNFLSLNNINALRTILTAYDFRAIYDHSKSKNLEKMLAGMLSIKSTEADRLFKGLVLRGAQSEIELNVEAFSCEGELYLFGSVLNEFLALYARINSFHQLTIKEVTHGEVYTWPARLSTVVL